MAKSEEMLFCKALLMIVVSLGDTIFVGGDTAVGHLMVGGINGS
jgi:hypothetical protein